MIRFFLGSCAVALALGGAAAPAHDYKAGALRIGHPWSRATPAGAKVGGGYLSIENTGATPDRLIAISAPVAGRAEMHEMSVSDGVMSMRPLERGVTIEPGAKLELKPGGFHIMFMDLARPLRPEERIKAVLTFEKAGPVEVEFKVEGIGARTSAPAEHAH